MTTITEVPNATASWIVQAVAAMREWLSECTWSDLDPADVDDLTDDEVIAGVRRHYHGGIIAFLEDSWMLV